jgi:hypothetical protein
MTMAASEKTAKAQKVTRAMPSLPPKSIKAGGKVQFQDFHFQKRCD